MEANLVLEKKLNSDITLEELKQISSPQYTKLYLKDFIDYLAPENLMTELFNIKSKLLKNGHISIQSFDLFELCNAVVDDKLQTIDFNSIIRDRKQLLAVADLTFILNKLNFKIISKDIDAFKFLIEAENV